MGGYLGNIPAEKYSALTRQSFTSPTGTSYTLNTSVSSSNDLGLYVNNIRQDPATYTANGTALTLTEALVSGDTMYCMYIGRATHTVNPASGSVGKNELSGNFKGLGSDSIIKTNAKTINENITFAGTENGMSAGPVTIANGVDVVITDGSAWSIV